MKAGHRVPHEEYIVAHADENAGLVPSFALFALLDFLRRLSQASSEAAGWSGRFLRGTAAPWFITAWGGVVVGTGRPYGPRRVPAGHVLLALAEN